MLSSTAARTNENATTSSVVVRETLLVGDINHASDEEGGAGDVAANSRNSRPSTSRVSDCDDDDDAVDDDDNYDPTEPTYIDHFSLRQPSSTVKFRRAKVHVYDTVSEQFILEDRRSCDNHTTDEVSAAADSDPLAAASDQQQQKKKELMNRRHHTITVKRMAWASLGLRILRLAYALVSIVLVGFFYVLCFQIILFLFMNLPANSGSTTESGGVAKPAHFIGILLSIPVFVFGLASLMAISTSFASDAWTGGSLFKAVMGLSSVFTEVLYFSIFLVVPALTMSITLLAGYESPWAICCKAWTLGVCLLFGIFGLSVVLREVSACFELIATHWGDADEELNWRLLARRALNAALLVTKYQYSGQRDARFLVSSDDEPPEKGYSFSDDVEPIQKRHGLYTRLTQLDCLKMFNKLDPPVRLYTTEEVRDLLPFINARNWSLEATCCRNHQARTITTAKGPGALTPAQVTLSVIINVAGAVLMTIFIVGLLMWIRVTVLVYVVTAIICALCCVLPMARSSQQVYYMYHDINSDTKDEAVDCDGGDDDEEAVGHVAQGEDAVDQENRDDTKPAVSTKKNKKKPKDETTMFQLWETVKVTEPKEWLCYVFISFEIAFLFIWPCVTLFVTGNRRVGGVFIIVGVFSFTRRFFDPAVVLSELGCITDIEIEKESVRPRTAPSMFARRSFFEGPQEERKLVVKSRLSNIIGDVTRSQSTGRWMWVFGVLMLICLLVFLSAVSSDAVTPNERAARPPIVLLDDFYYEGETDSVQYPSCELSKGFKIPAAGNTSTDSMLADYSMMSILAYEKTTVTDYILPQWFGDGQCVDEADFVSSWRLASGTADNPIFFKLYTFPNIPEFAVVAIRGSETDWDWLVNMQLWSASGLVQMFKWLTPWGWIWDPMLDELVDAVSWVQSEKLREVSYYTVTTSFVNDLFEGFGGRASYGALRVTGVSLGGGLASITGAQTRVPAIAISGPGPELGRHTWSPPVTMDQINKNVFNWVPDRDYIARLGGRPRNNQAAECLAPPSDLFGCHSMWRSICEMQYRCGSNGRPIICSCGEYGYPPPIQNGTRSFEEACQEQEEAFLSATSA